MGISLKIQGNKRSNEGVGADLVSIGDNRFPVVDAQYPGTRGATDFIVVRHLHDKSIYTIVCKNVTPCDSNREGTLYISVAVPVKEHVDGLFNMLIELQNAYKGTCMTYDGAMYHFTARNDAPQTFEDIISRHKVTHYPYRPVVTADDMSAIAYLFMTPEQISDVLDDPMRGEFARFGQIVLVPVADPSQYVSTINVPAKIWRSYKIYVNGRQTGQTLADPNKTVTITLPETSSHESVSTTFSIAQARDTRLPGIAIDDEAQIIYLNMQPKAKEKPPMPVTDDPAPRNTPRNNKLFYVVIGLLVAVIAVLAYLLLFAPKDEAEKNVDPTEKINSGENGDSIVNRLNEPNDTISEGNGSTGDNEPDNSGNMTTGNDNAKGTDPSDKLLNEDRPTAEETAAKIRATYENYVNDINNAERHSFGELKKIFNFYTRYNTNEWDSSFGEKVALVKSVVEYIEGLNPEIPSNTYTAKINGFINDANQLGLNNLGTALKKRTEGGPSAIKETMNVKDNFSGRKNRP